MMEKTDDVRIAGLKPLLPPAILMEELPATEQVAHTVAGARRQVAAVLAGEDDRLVVVVGPCSIHDPDAGLAYARMLKGAADRLADDLLVIMRVYFEKPRTTVGWKGLINDPDLDDSFRINRGLRKARGLLLEVTGLGLPCGTEFLDPIGPQFIADLIVWGAIGARTSESQVHRELASGLSMPVGFKNGTGGSLAPAIDAIRASANPHHFLSVTKQGVAAIVATQGNPECHLILRGGIRGPNFDAEAVGQAVAALEKVDLPGRLMVDCSHANSGKDHAVQPQVAESVAAQIAGGSRRVMGVMLESFLEAGRQDLEPGRPLVYGQSITDACMSWDQTVPVLEGLAEAVRARRAAP